MQEELMEADLHAIIRSGQPLTDQHFQSFIYQTLCGLLVCSAALLQRHPILTYLSVHPLSERIAS
jgi:mitogen-activated protein kinase 7